MTTTILKKVSESRYSTCTRKIPDNKKKSSFNTEKKKKNSAITQKAQKIRQLEKSTSIFFFSLLQKNMQDFLQKI